MFGVVGRFLGKKLFLLIALRISKLTGWGEDAGRKIAEELLDYRAKFEAFTKRSIEINSRFRGVLFRLTSLIVWFFDITAFLVFAGGVWHKCHDDDDDDKTV